ncbi:hypothetical protein ACWCQZ_02790 [Streptomyces sp. NPDC002285]
MGITVAAGAALGTAVISGFGAHLVSGVMGLFGDDPSAQSAVAWDATWRDPMNGCEAGKGRVQPVRPSRLGPPGDLAATGVIARGNVLVVTVQSPSAAAVVLTGARVEVVARRSPIAGTFEPPAEGCGSFSYRSFVLDLDKPNPLLAPARETDVTGEEGGAEPAGQGQGQGQDHSVTFPFKVSEGDPEQFWIRVDTRTCDCDWVLHLDWIDGGERREATVSDHGEPFRTTSVADSPSYSYDSERRQWRPDARCEDCAPAPTAASGASAATGTTP